MSAGTVGIEYHCHYDGLIYMVRQRVDHFAHTTNVLAAANVPSLRRGIKPWHYQCVGTQETMSGIKLVWRNIVVTSQLYEIDSPFIMDGIEFAIWKWVGEAHLRGNDWLHI